MDTSTEAGLSKVTVECTDPSGLFSEVQSVLSKRIPLKNLHWKSPSRPARSIESLNIDLVPSQPVADEKRPSNDVSPSPVLHRRHQIPGLRQTPYLKIYLLRCDDSEVYKTSSRKLLREWIKTHSVTQQASGGSQDNHDAFEWLILHVPQDGGAPEKATSTSKWPGRGSTSVLEKVKADFNGSSKAAIDRVAQLRIPKGGKAQDPQELIDQLNDLVDKMKNAILTSFDLRVRQYEEEIREKGSQRTLPGWNFCTFFILKEGLARGFENVGLLEDALVGYDELAAGLESAVADFLSGTSDQHGGGFLNFSVDRKEIAETALEASTQQSDAERNGDDINSTGDDISMAVDEEHFPLDSAKKPYRDMILANNISIFDFRVYVFSRQLNLLLRAARAPFLQRSRESAPKAEDLNLLAEICDRAMEFIILAARTLRYDLECALAESTGDSGNARKSRVIDNIVSSWTYAASCQILSQTVTSSLTIPDSSLRRARSSTDASAVVAAVADSRPNVPKRSSSLITSGMSSGRPDSLVTPTGPNKTVSPKTGSDDLASGRGELYQLARGILEEIGRRRAWVQKWDDLNLLFDEVSTVSESFEEVSLDSSDGTKHDSIQQPYADITAGIDLPPLMAAVTSRKIFYLLFEELTDQMFRHYVSASRTRSAEASMTEIAVLRYRQGDYETAATYFKQIVPFYSNSNWLALEGSVLELYARCLKELKQDDEYVRTILRLLSQYASHTQSNLSVYEKSLLASSATPVRSNARPYIEDLLRVSKSLQKEFTVPITSLFSDIEADPEIRHYEDRDGFQLQLRLRFLLDKDIQIDSIKVRLVTASGVLSNEVWLERSGDILVKSSTTKLLIDSSTTLHGKYFVDRIEMRVKNIVFTLGGGSASSFFPPGFRDGEKVEEETRPFVWCYPPPHGLEARLASPRYINLEELRTLEIELESGRNNVSKAVLRVRPATAGLRLRIAETEVVDGEIEMTANPESGSIEIADLDMESAVRCRIPYTIDENHTTLSARLEVVYETDLGRFTYCSTSSIVSTLPVSVNVQDVFKEDALFSRFTVSPAMLIPLRVLGCDLPPSNFCDVESSLQGPVAMDVFPKQPASVVYKIQLKQNRPQISPDKKRSSLRLTVQFTCLDEECLALVKQRFWEAISQSQFRQLVRLLTPHIVEAFRTQLSTSDMEAIGLLREVEMLPYDNVQWGLVLSGLGESLRKEVEEWLSQWHQSNPVFSLPDPDPSLLSRQIVIPVDVPEIQVVHTAELRLGHPSIGSNATVHAAVGHMIPVELVLRHTRRWCSNRTEAADTPLEFAYEIHANPDLWLVGGRRRGNFTAEEGETKSFALMLLPQRAGHLLLPAIDIKTFVSGPSSSTAQPPPAVPGAASSFPAAANSLTTLPSTAGQPGGNPPLSGAGAGAGAAAAATPLQPQRRQVPNEVDYKNHSETLLVLPDLKKTTVGLESGNPGLIESERRIEV